MEGGRPTPSLLVVGGVGAGSDSPFARWGTASERAGDEDGIVTAGVPAPAEGLKVV